MYSRCAILTMIYSSLNTDTRRTEMRHNIKKCARVKVLFLHVVGDLKEIINEAKAIPVHSHFRTKNKP